MKSVWGIQQLLGATCMATLSMVAGCHANPNNLCNLANDCVQCLENEQGQLICEEGLTYCHLVPPEEQIVMDAEPFAGHCEAVHQELRQNRQCAGDFTVTNQSSYFLLKEIIEDVYACDTLVGTLTILSTEQNDELPFQILFPSITVIDEGNLIIENANITSASFPNLTSVDALVIENNSLLQTTNFQNLQSASIYIEENTGILPLYFASLSDAEQIEFRHNTFEVERQATEENPYPTQIHFPSLQTNHNFIFLDNENIYRLLYSAPDPEIQLHINHRFSIDSNPQLFYVDIENLHSTGICRDPFDLTTCREGRIEITGNPSLIRANFHHLARANELWVFNNVRYPACFGVDIFLSEYFNAAEVRTFLAGNNGPCQ